MAAVAVMIPVQNLQMMQQYGLPVGICCMPSTPCTPSTPSTDLDLSHLETISTFTDSPCASRWGSDAEESESESQHEESEDEQEEKEEPRDLMRGLSMLSPGFSGKAWADYSSDSELEMDMKLKDKKVKLNRKKRENRKRSKAQKAQDSMLGSTTFGDWADADYFELPAKQVKEDTDARTESLLVSAEKALARLQESVKQEVELMLNVAEQCKHDVHRFTLKSKNNEFEDFHARMVIEALAWSLNPGLDKKNKAKKGAVSLQIRKLPPQVQTLTCKLTVAGTEQVLEQTFPACGPFRLGEIDLEAIRAQEKRGVAVEITLG